MDVTFDYTGQNVATASADGTAKLFSTVTHKCSVKLEGHSGEVSKVGVCMSIMLESWTTLSWGFLMAVVVELD